MIPLDTHAQDLLRPGARDKENADLQAAIEDPRLQGHPPRRPARYDFTLTRFGIRGDLEMKDLLDPLR